MSEASAHGAPHEIDWRGRKWKMGPFVGDLIGHYEQWLKGQAWREIEEDRVLVARGELDADVYQERHKAVSKLVAGKEHRNGGEVYRSSLGTEAGIVRVAYLMIWSQEPEFTPEMAALMYAEIPEIVISRMMDLRRFPNRPGETTPLPA